MEKKSQRFYVLDILRGIVVFLMILAHSVYFFHDYTSPLLAQFEKVGNTFCYTTFLLISGAVCYIAYLQDEKFSARKRILHRLLVLLISYYAISLFVLSRELSQAFGYDRLRLIFDLLTFRLTPSFLEYVPPFIFYSFLIAILPKISKKVGQKISWLIIISIAAYLAGFFINKTNSGLFLSPWKAFLAGSDGFYRFPILQYLPVFFIGLYWGQYLQKTNNLFHKKNILIELIVILGITFILTLAAYNLFHIPLADAFLRWPPKPAFIVLGLLFAFTLTYFLYHSHLLKKAKTARHFFLLLGQNAFGVFASHIFLVYLFQFAGGDRSSSIVIFLVEFLLLVIASLALATFIPFNRKFALNMIRNSHEEVHTELNPIVSFEEDLDHGAKKDFSLFKNFFFPRKSPYLADKRKIKKRHFLAVSLLLLIISFLILPSIHQEIAEGIKNTPAPWWDKGYAYRQTLKISNQESFSKIPSGQSVVFSINHGSLVKSGKSLSSAADIRVVFWNGKNYLPVTEKIIGESAQSETEFEIITESDLSPGQTEDNYYIYYGNPLVESAPMQSEIKEKLFDYKAIALNEESYPILASVDRVWYLAGEDKEITVNVKTKQEDLINGSFALNNEDFTGQLTKVDNVDDEWAGKIDISSLKPGNYYIKARFQDLEGNLFYSQKTGFKLSYPVYVSWTQDWEGYDVPENYLVSIAQVADKFEIPMTHFFNPRIFVAADITPSRQEYLTDWVKERTLEKNEEIAMHLHGFHDLIRASGVEPITEQNWGDKGDGYGVPISAYSGVQLDNIFKYCLQLFNQNGLPAPAGFRAGGWFADSNVLKAASTNGFDYDSSGRTAYSFGRNNMKGLWNLNPTSQPYYPSFSNQNSFGNDSLEILEIPNNGADSYWFEKEELLSRFHQNYKGNITKSPIQITYLTHPHWFNQKEREKIEILFEEVDNYSYRKDSGPVIFSTTENIYQVFKDLSK